MPAPVIDEPSNLALEPANTSGEPTEIGVCEEDPVDLVGQVDGVLNDRR